MFVAACTSNAPSPTPTATATAAAATPTPVAALPASLFLDVTAPSNESIVTATSVTVQGTTTTDAVVSINGITVEVDPLGGFTAEVTLDEGPNVIDVIASDLSAQQSVQLAVISVPGQ
jgi:hypothetical protein